MKRALTETPKVDLAAFVPKELRNLDNPQTDLPRIARDPKVTALIEAAFREVPAHHELYHHDARDLSFLKPESVHLVSLSALWRGRGVVMRRSKKPALVSQAIPDTRRKTMQSLPLCVYNTPGAVLGRNPRERRPGRRSAAQEVDVQECLASSDFKPWPS